MTRPYRDVFYQSHDGLSLYARDYGQVGKTYPATLFCMHGLTRNSADFERLAGRYGGQYRVISMDQRGRGRSEYDPNPDQYRPDIYCRDMTALIEHLTLTNLIAVGTSMGGLMAMMMAATNNKLFRAVVLNDIGCVLEEEGLNHIRSYVGKIGPFKNWDEAVKQIKTVGAQNFPAKSDEDWDFMVRAACKQGADGGISFAYDPAIMNGLSVSGKTKAATVPPNLWGVFEAMDAVPTTLFRGQLSKLLSVQTCQDMQARHSHFGWSEIEGVGHTPLLNEPEVLGVLDPFLAEHSQ